MHTLLLTCYDAAHLMLDGCTHTETLSHTQSLCRHRTTITYTHTDMELCFLPADEMELYKSKLYTEKACYKF